MPFIDPRRREEFEAEGLGQLCRSIRDRLRAGDFIAGDLAFIVYTLMQAATGIAPFRYIQRATMMHDVLEAWLTWRRLHHDPAEDEAAHRNGDIG